MAILLHQLASLIQAVYYRNGKTFLEGMERMLKENVIFNKFIHER